MAREGRPAMSFARRIVATLHREHVESIGLLERIEAALARQKANVPPPPGDPAWTRLLSEFAGRMGAETERHFAFEEEKLFPILVERGEDDIVGILREEHDAIRALAVELRADFDAAQGGFDPGRWGEFRQCVGELVERQVSHIQKEELSLLPVLEDAIDEATDTALAQNYLEAA
jgi:hemerythrin-like domain-containing protein